MASDFRGLFSLLESQGIRYVLVGGLAALLHGVDRVTADIERLRQIESRGQPR